MFTDYSDQLKIWQHLFRQCFGFGFHITAARIWAISTMIEEWRDISRRAWTDPEAVQAMDSMLALCERAKQTVNKGQPVFIYMLIDLISNEITRVTENDEALSRAIHRSFLQSQADALIANAPQDVDPLVQSDTMGDIPF